MNDYVYCKWSDEALGGAGKCTTYKACLGTSSTSDFDTRPQWLPQGTSVYDVDENGTRRQKFTGKIHQRDDGAGLSKAGPFMRVVPDEPDTDMADYLSFELDVLKNTFNGKWLLIKDLESGVEDGVDKSEVVKVVEVKGVDVGNGETKGDIQVNPSLGLGDGNNGYIEFEILRNGLWEDDPAIPLLVPQDNTEEIHAAGTPVVLLLDELLESSSESDDETKPLLIF